MIQVNKEEYYDAVCAQLPELNYEMGMSTCGGDKDFYLELLKDFTELPVVEELSRYLREDNSKNYCIRVHGFKNNAYSVGAKQLGDLAYELEKITKESSFEGVPGLQAEMFELFESVCKRYREVVLR